MRTAPAGFSLIEVMIVVTVIGILGGMARVAFAHVTLRARAAAYINDCRVFSEAFQRYTTEKGAMPPEQTRRRTVPTGMGTYLRASDWLKETPIGGDYEWDTNAIGIARRLGFNGGIRVNGSKLKLADLRQIDRWFDDGNLATGNLIVRNGGARVFFILE